MARLVPTILLATGWAAGLATAPAMALSHQVQHYRAELVPLNGSDVSGIVRLTLDQTDALNPTLRVRLFAENLPVSSEADAYHGMHLTGRFEGQDLFQENGPFFEGAGGTSDLTRLPTRLPTVESNDVNLDGFLSPREILPASGVAVVNLTDPQSEAPASGITPVSTFDPAAFPVASSDVIDYDQTFT